MSERELEVRNGGCCWSANAASAWAGIASPRRANPGAISVDLEAIEWVELLWRARALTMPCRVLVPVPVPVPVAGGARARTLRSVATACLSGLGGYAHQCEAVSCRPFASAALSLAHVLLEVLALALLALDGDDDMCLATVMAAVPAIASLGWVYRDPLAAFHHHHHQTCQAWYGGGPPSRSFPPLLHRQQSHAGGSLSLQWTLLAGRQLVSRHVDHKIGYRYGGRSIELNKRLDSRFCVGCVLGGTAGRGFIFHVSRDELLTAGTEE